MPTSIHSRRLVLQLAGASLITGIAIAAADAPETPDSAAPAPSPVGKWLAEDILGGGVIDNARTTLEIEPDGAVTGNGGCNGYGGRAAIDGDRISFGPLASTRMACAEALMNQEARFFQVLELVGSFRIDPQGKLLLIDGGGDVVMRLASG